MNECRVKWKPGQIDFSGDLMLRRALGKHSGRTTQHGKLELIGVAIEFLGVSKTSILIIGKGFF